MVYKWKMEGLNPVDAQVAGEELERIHNKYGGFTPAQIVDESRSEKAPLHVCFEWNDNIAAEKYREEQAAMIVRHIVVEAESNKGEPVEVRAFVHVQKEYQPIGVVLENKDKFESLLEQAWKDMMAFKNKYSVLSELGSVIDAMDVVLNMAS